MARRRALDERGKLLEAHYAGAIPLDLLRSEQDRIGSELNHVEDRLGALELKFDTIERNLKAAPRFVTDLHGAYVSAPPKVRRRINQAIFERILISDDGDMVGELHPPFGLLVGASGVADDSVLVAHEMGTKRPRDRFTGLMV